MNRMQKITDHKLMKNKEHLAGQEPIRIPQQAVMVVARRAVLDRIMLLFPLSPQ
jgi:hypothetical protein